MEGSGVSPPSVVESEVAERLRLLQDRIRAVGRPDVSLVAVTKGFDRSAVDAALSLGLRTIGENYAQELLAKAAHETGPGAVRPEWHFLGSLQRNKVRRLAPHVAVWQSVDRQVLGEEIARWAPESRVLVQVNISGEEQKGGCTWGEAAPLVGHLAGLGLSVVGLMGVGPTGPPEASREPFRRLVGLAEELGLAVRSIGMTDDLEVALEEGSTMLRLGRSLFGRRAPR